MNLLADKTGEQFLSILEEDGDKLLVQFITNEGRLIGKPFKDSKAGLFLTGWRDRETSTVIGLTKFKQGITEDAEVSFALHQLYPLGRKVKLPTGEIFLIASYANTHADGYYMFLKKSPDADLVRMKMTPDWELQPSEELLRLPYYPAPLSQAELDNIDEFDAWAGGF